MKPKLGLALPKLGLAYESMRVLISNSAFSDLENIKEHYQAQDAPEVGVNFISEIFSRIKTLNEHPLIGRCVPEFNDDSIREIIHHLFGLCIY